MDRSCFDGQAPPGGRLLKPGGSDWSDGERRRDGGQRHRRRPCVMTTLFVIATIVAVLASGSSCYAFLKLRKAAARQPPYACCLAGHPLEAAPSSSSAALAVVVPCLWNRTKETGRIIVQSLASDSTKESIDNSFHVSYRETHNYTSENSRTDETRPIRNWLLRGVGCRKGRSIRYDRTRGRFTIGRSGHYVVYSHVTFQPPPDVIYRLQADGKSRAFSFAHVVAIWRSDRNYRTEVLKDRREVTCPTVQRYARRPHPCHVTDQAAILWLERGDVLTLEVAPIEYVLGDLSSSYFGSVLLK